MRIRKTKVDFPEDSIIIAKVSDALAHPLRVEMLKFIYHENIQRRKPCTKDLVAHFAYSQSTISQHMTFLSACGLIEVQKSNGYSFYFVNIGLLGKYLNAVKKLNQ